jgi:thiol-disulfide isomerase/thioredoxin
MNKKPLIISVIIAVLILGGGIYLLTSSDAKEAKQKMTGETRQSATPVSSESPGTYVDYHESIIESTSGTKLLFFHAPWCPQCRSLEADIKAKGVPAGVTIIKVDYDTSQALRQKYGVTLQTTVVRVDDKGELVNKYVAYGEPTLSALVNKLLN